LRQAFGVILRRSKLPSLYRGVKGRSKGK